MDYILEFVQDNPQIEPKYPLLELLMHYTTPILVYTVAEGYTAPFLMEAIETNDVDIIHVFFHQQGYSNFIVTLALTLPTIMSNQVARDVIIDKVIANPNFFYDLSILNSDIEDDVNGKRN